MLNIEIDGKEIAVADGSTVMDAANLAGIHIPHFCYHKKLSIAANCRMCLVQVEKAPKPLPACATPVTPGMKVHTHSELAVAAQKGVMEFLLINHPLDCPICDQGGECQLQDLSVGYGQSSSNYQEEKRVVSNKDLGPLISTDMTRCIHCTRCVRFSDEIAGFQEMGMAGRGEHSEIMPFIEKTVQSEISGNVIDLCPVGALTSKPFRFSARTWELSRRKSVSPHDALGSNLIVQVKHDVVKRVVPLENEAINECWLSDRDRFAYEGLNHTDRLTRPMIKQDGRWHEVDWTQALEYAGHALSHVRAHHGADKIGALLSPYQSNEELYLAQKLVRGLGSANVDSRLRRGDFRADAQRGAAWLGQSVEAFAASRHFFVIGSLLREEQPLLAQRVRQAVKGGARLSVLDCVRQNWLTKVDNQLLARAQDLVFSLGEVLAAVAQQLGQPTPASVSWVTAISPEAKALALALVETPASIVLGALAQGVAEADRIQQLAAELAAMTQGVLGVLPEAGNSVGAHWVGATPFQGAGKNTAQMLGSAPMKAYVLLGVEPDRDLPNPALALQALQAADTVVALTAYQSPALLACADVLLPIATYSETAGSYVNLEGRVQSFNAVVKPRGDVRPAWKVLRVLGNVLTLPGFEQNDVAAVRAEALPAAAEQAARLNNRLPQALEGVPARFQGLARLGVHGMYHGDPVVRRAASLQRTAQAESSAFAAIHPATRERLGLAAGVRVKVKQGQAEAEYSLQDDLSVLPETLRVAAGSAQAASLGASYDAVTVEKA